MEKKTDRNTLLALDDESLCRLCTFEFFKSSGPGGQHRNKVSSAVRVKLVSFDISAEDCSERTQHRNRANALNKLRHLLALKVREEISDAGEGAAPEAAEGRVPFDCSMRNPRYYLFIARLLDHLEAAGFDQRQAAAVYGVSPTALIRKIAADPSLWAHCQRRREELGLCRWRQ